MENKMNSQTSFQQSDNCYHDHRLEEDQTATAIAAVGRSITSTPLPDPVVTENSLESHNKSKDTVVETAVVAVPKKAVNRCGCCNKKVGLVGFKCRCGITFCGTHRYPEEHNCSFDYKSVGRDAIAKANPLVIADKLQRF